MCEVATLASIALTGASAAMNGIAASRADNARAEAMRAEFSRQDALDREASAINVQSRDRYQGFEGQQQERSQKLGDYFKQQMQSQDASAAADASGATAPPSSSNITVQEIAKKSGEARDFADRTGEALGNLRSFGDLLGGISREQARDAGRVGQIGGFKAGSSAVLPAELEVASSKGAGFKMLGDLLGIGGQMAMGSALQGSFVSPGGVGIPKIPTTGGGFSNLPTFAQPTATPPLSIGRGGFLGASNPYRVY